MTALDNRLPPPLVFLAVAGLMWLATLYIEPMEVLGSLRWPLIGFFFVLALVGPLGIREFSRAKTTIDPIKIDNASTLITSGVFGVTRNPMYLSMALLLTVWALYLSVPWTWVGPIVFALFITRFQIVPEERVMAAKFGSAFASYRARVRRWI